MNEDLYGITDDELHSYVVLQVALEKDQEEIIGEELAFLHLFGKDVREVTTKIDTMLKSNVILREKYREKYQSIKEVTDGLAAMSDRQIGVYLGIPAEMAKMSRIDNARRLSLERELSIETAHLSGFGRRIKEYLSAKVRAEDTHKDAPPLWKANFNKDSECEEYLAKSELCKKLEETYRDKLPFYRRVYKGIRGDSKESE